MIHTDIASDVKTLAVQKMYREFPYPPEFSRWYCFGEGRKLLRKGRRMGEALLGIEPSLATGRILDVGCGTGLRTIGMAKALPAAKILALELSEASRDLALPLRQRLRVIELLAQPRLLHLIARLKV